MCLYLNAGLGKISQFVISLYNTSLIELEFNFRNIIYINCWYIKNIFLHLFVFQIGKIVSTSKAKYYFAVDTNYVGKKIGLVLFPFAHKVSLLNFLCIFCVILKWMLIVCYCGRNCLFGYRQTKFQIVFGYLFKRYSSQIILCLCITNWQKSNDFYLIFFSQDWSIRYNQDEPVAPRYEINAPDLYIPGMLSVYIIYI